MKKVLCKEVVMYEVNYIDSTDGAQSEVFESEEAAVLFASTLIERGLYPLVYQTLRLCLGD